jgi:hydrophobic/amphiphilic exporter-1 (mainly G- bacteria), HAE1 family
VGHGQILHPQSYRRDGNSHRHRIIGLVSLSRLPIAEYPQVSPTLIEATATYRGAGAEAVMDSVATPIESKVNGVDKMLYMQSFSANDGKMVLKVTLDVA